MKLGKRISGTGRPPLILFTELAEEFGLSPLALVREMRWPKAPYPQHAYKSNTRTYYEAKPMRDWWKAHNEAKETA